MKRKLSYVLALVLLLPLGALHGQAPKVGPGPLVLVRLHGIVQPITAEHVDRALAWAAAHHARAVVLQLDTPGGLDTSMRDIIQKVLGSPVPILGWVGPNGARAASAGFFVLMSCDVAAMAPQTNTGAAHPVFLQGQPGKVEASKVENDALAFLRALTSERHRNTQLAQTAVSQSQSFSAQEALKGQLIEGLANSPQELLRQWSGKPITRPNGAQQSFECTRCELVRYPMSLRERVLDFDPNFAYLLLLAGLGCIVIEFTHPGVIVPGVVGVILVTVAVFALSMLPLNWAGVALLLLGLILFALEAKIASHGALAIGGVVSLVLGAVLLVNTADPAARISWSVALGAGIGFGLVVVALLQLVLRARHSKVVTGQQGLIGQTALAFSALQPDGKVYFQGEYWNASARQAVEAGATVRITAVRGLHLEVEALPKVSGLGTADGREPAPPGGPEVR